MQIILLQRVDKLGLMGDVVRVKDGYARNFLLPQGKALRATPENVGHFETERGQLEAQNLERKSEAEQVAERMAGLAVVLVRQASDTGQLYGSVNARDIADAVIEAGFQIDRKQVGLNRAIKTLGIHPVSVALHPEVGVLVSANVARSADEAELQAAAERGEAPAAEDEADAAEVQVAEFFEEDAQAAAEEQLAEAAETAEEEAVEAETESKTASTDDDASEEAKPET